MSRVGSVILDVKAGVNVDINNFNIKVKSSGKELSMDYSPNLDIKLNDNKISITPKKDNKETRSLWGMTNRIISNMIVGVTDGFTKILELHGVGFKAVTDGKILTLSLGYSHDIKMIIPAGIAIKCPKATEIQITGSDNQRVGQIAADIRSLRKPEPYKGKGVKYKGEIIRRKEGKKK